MTSKFYKCANCSKQYHFTGLDTVYRCGDAYVCSNKCAQERLKKIMGFDPLLSHPILWDATVDGYCNVENEPIETEDMPLVPSDIELTDTTLKENHMSLNDIEKARKEETEYVEKLNFVEETSERNTKKSQKIKQGQKQTQHRNSKNVKIHPASNKKSASAKKSDVLNNRNLVLCNACFRGVGFCLMCVLMVSLVVTYARSN